MLLEEYLFSKQRCLLSAGLFLRTRFKTVLFSLSKDYSPAINPLLWTCTFAVGK